MFKRLFSDQRTLNYIVFSSITMLILVFILFAYKVKLKVGHLPYYAHPDPKNIDLDFYYSLVYLCFYTVTIVTVSRSVVIYFQKLNFYLTFAVLFFSGILLLVFTEDQGTFFVISYVFSCFLSSIFLAFYGLFSQIKKGFDLSYLSMSCCLFLFWGHNLFDPFRLIDWFLD